MRDLRIALRLFRRRPGFCAAVIIIIAVALGASSAIFTLVNALLIRPLPFPRADQLVEVNALLGNDQGRLTLFEYTGTRPATRERSKPGARTIARSTT